MRVLDTAFAKGFIRVCDDGFNQNWHERNGGNLATASNMRKWSP